MKLGIGTAQFGLDYGISNQEGKTPPDEIEKILEIAAQNGVRIIDTAPAYGTSEQVLGKILPSQHNFDIVTKTPSFSKICISKNDAQFLEATFYESLCRLNQSYVYGLLVHNANDLLAENGHLLMESILNLKQQGLLNKIGVSIYTAEQIDRVLEKYSIDLIQVPVNVFDQRLIASGHLQQLKEQKIEIHARSIFLQGLLLMEPEHLPHYFDSIRQHLESYYSIISQHGISRLEAALSWVTGLSEIDVVLFGVATSQQLQEVLLASLRKIGIKYPDFSKFAIADNSIVNPSSWRI